MTSLHGSLRAPAVSIERRLMAASSGSVEEALEEAKRREIKGDSEGDRRVEKFLELVVLPMAVCAVLILVLRRGFLD